MAGDWFFLSYARLDSNNDPHGCIRQFYDDLDREICRKRVIREGSAGFYDGAGIQQGEQWPESLGTALNTARALVCMYSPAYFDSDYCGKEVAVFNARVERFMRGAPPGAQRPGVILPVLLDAPHELGRIPEVLAETQYSDNSYPEVYRQEGLLYMFRRNSSELRDRYQDFLDALVSKLLRAAQEQALPGLEELPDIRTLQSAFHQPSPPPLAGVPAATSGPRYAEFIYVAGTRDEVEPLRRMTESYGEVDGSDWRPYMPQSEDEVWLITQSVASMERFRYRSLPSDENLIEAIDEAEKNNRIVVIVVDTWTLRLHKYGQLMRSYDRLNFGNAAVLVVRNDADEETANNRSVLDLAVKQAFVFKSRLLDPHGFVAGVGTQADLSSILGITLQRLSAQIIETNQLRCIEAGQLMGKPEITGPGAATI